MKSIASRFTKENILFAACIFIYLAIRLIGLTDYPSYFNFDEADKTVLAADFLRDGFRTYNKELFPAFFPNPGNNFNVGSTAVYIQMIPLVIFGRSDYAIRLTTVLVGLIGVICVSLALRDIFKARYWWSGILVLSAIPAWFHHSRTGYEMPIFVSFFSAMLYCYWKYRAGQPTYLYPAILFSFLAFYSYAPALALIPLTVLVLFILDFRFHIQTKRSLVGGAMLGFVCVIPFIRFQLTHIGQSAETLGHVGSYWVENLPLTEKIYEFAATYLFHLSPLYWFTPAYDVTPNDGLLHIMKGYGHLGLWLLPFVIWGFWLMLRRLRQPEYRTLLAVLLIAPVAASLVTSPSSITRALVMVIPAALIGSIGLDDLSQKVVGRFKLKSFTPAFVLFLLLSLNFYMLWDVLNNGVSWFENNQANGVQFGANKVFTALKEERRLTPGAHAVISPEWCMMGDYVARIYLGDKANIEFHSIYDYAKKMYPLKAGTIFVITPEEMKFAQNNPKFSDIQVLRTIPYSKTKVGFYLIHLKYSPQGQALFANEDVERHQPAQGEVTIDGQKVQVGYTKSAGTPIEAVFDDDPVSLYKTLEINPALFELTFPEEREFHSIFIIHGAAPIELQATFISPMDDSQTQTFTAQFSQNGDNGNTLELGQTIRASKVKLSVKALYTNETALVHIWEIKFK